MWETLDTFTERLRVPGGWIVRSSYKHIVNDASVSVTCHQLFIADAEHAWTLPTALTPHTIEVPTGSLSAVSV